MVALSAKAVTKRYRDLTAVDGLDLEIDDGTVLALLGPNGAGKTTTVEMCEGFASPDEGTIEVLGLDPVADAARLRPRIGVMLQGGGAYPGAKAGEMLRLVAAYSANPLDPDWLLKTLGLADAATVGYRRLSGGQQQRLALACAIVGRPELVFLDEPTAGLDAQARLLVWDLVDSLRRDGVTVLLTTHLLDEAEELADRVVIIDHGRTVAAGTPTELTHAGSQNELRFTAVRGLDAAGLATRLGAGFAVDETQRGGADGQSVYVVRGRAVTPREVAGVAAWCAGENALISNLHVGAKSLEDVFLDLTGRDLRG
ncbi:ABC transporter ATP-binding protein [Tsukamurella sp. 8F]|uniref:ABC transporter ATP-binding protein n=1 Tax=unclassified Tsukamurella TaxID=2633480 RepID=UPI0023B8FEB8|nr:MULTISPECIES: ABC transporter ATP-binding protein [unclassified Tsukamurella]MDF0528570.1 ABC transporter ATP-binding protein [Tsukamurella sp. 8J]MDF0585532.1 ABC transporter ATP-binding protein [Tsukamurella sp. 8F]